MILWPHWHPIYLSLYKLHGVILAGNRRTHICKICDLELDDQDDMFEHLCTRQHVQSRIHHGRMDRAGMDLERLENIEHILPAGDNTYRCTACDFAADGRDKVLRHLESFDHIMEVLHTEMEREVQEWVWPYNYGEQDEF